MRTYKAALESRPQKRIPSHHPVIRWLVEHTTTVLNKYNLHDHGDGLISAYEFLHGKKASERLAEFGEIVLLFIPRARRAKLGLPWSAGI